MRIDWERIEHEYVTGKMTMDALAKKHNIKLNTFYHKAKERGFSEKRESYTKTVQEKALARARARDVRTLSNLCAAMDKAARQLNKYISDDDTLHGKVVNHMDGSIEEVRTKKLDTKAMRDLTSAIKDLTAAMQLLAPDTGREEDSGGVIILPEREADE